MHSQTGFTPSGYEAGEQCSAARDLVPANAGAARPLRFCLLGKGCSMIVVMRSGTPTGGDRRRLRAHPAGGPGGLRQRGPGAHRSSASSGSTIDRVSAHRDACPASSRRSGSPHRYKLASLEHQRDRTRITIGGKVGMPSARAAPLVVMAGPCSVESREQLIETAALCQARGRADPARRRLQAADLARTRSRAWARTASTCSSRRARRPACPSCPR